MRSFHGLAAGITVVAVSLVLQTGWAAQPAHQEPLQLKDVFQLEYAADPRISPDGRRIVYVRTMMDINSDRTRGKLWIIDADGARHRPVSDREESETSPRWSPDGDRLLYVSSTDQGSQIFLRWLETGQTARLAQLQRSPSNLSWSPDGSRIAFSMLVPEAASQFVSLPSPPEGASWARPARVIEKLVYRADGSGFLEDGYRQIFVLPAEGGTPRQVTSGPYHHSGTISWTPDNDALLFSANRHPDGEHDPNNSEIYRLSLDDGSLQALTDRQGPDHTPRMSPDGRWIAYLGFDDRYQGYQVTRLSVMAADGSRSRVISGELDRSVGNIQWAGDSDSLFFQYDNEGNTSIARISLEGAIDTLTGDVGGLSLGRPYSGGTFSVQRDGVYAFTHSRPDHPADVAVGRGGNTSRLTDLNADLFATRHVGDAEEIWWESSHDGRRIQGWIVKPPGFSEDGRYPLLLEIHGGPFTNYGDRFSAEVQLYAAAGYVVLYANPRGSTSYGGEFGNLIHHAYPGYDYDDLMSGVDAVIGRGYVDPDRLFVTGGSGGGVLTSWIVGKTDRFRAAVVAKPVINWISFALTADAYNNFYKYWFPGPPWDHAEHYWRRSPLLLVGNVTTPTMVLTGEVDYRTPMSESEQYYQALQLRKVPSALVRIPEASHGIAARPSQLISKVGHILEWFRRHDAGAERRASGP